MEEWYYIISNEPHKKYYCDDYEDVQSSISLDSIFKIPINKYLDDIIAEPKVEVIDETEKETQPVPKTKYNKKKVTTEISD